ncbi:DUF2784 domain-containing protein [Phycisphaerales bacterium AB-hyl4]|uniref:DUF2784 domain-containing protein n=1 Tax=Natronomicrosphaera hydrolytica TaxID=3242702 RepID=A0ABV4U203_9BACT
MIYRVLADITLVTHVAFVGFVVFGLVLTLVGGVAGWRWVRHVWFRAAHLVAIGIVVVQAWLGVACPLTVLENHLRRAAGQDPYEQGFVADWSQPLIFFNAEPWVFTLAYTLFGGLVVLSLWLVPVRWRGGDGGGPTGGQRSSGLLTR